MQSSDTARGKYWTLLHKNFSRSPLIATNSRSQPDCTPFADIDRKAFDTYTKLLKTPDFRNFLKVDSVYPKSYKWHPHPSRCDLGQMTAEGALQLIKLGTHLHEKYKNAGLFDGSCLLLSVHTTSVFRYP